MYVPIFDIEQVKEKVDLRDISILKIDVEGAELEVLQSFKKEISISEPIILIEILPVYEEGNTVRLEKQRRIEKLINDLGFVIYRILKKGANISDLQRIENFGVHGDVNLCDYVLVPQGKIESFERSSSSRSEQSL